MNKQFFRIFTGWSALISMVLAFGTILVSAVALDFDPDLFNAAVSDNAAIVLPILAENPALAWWPSIFDFFGFYILLLPLALYLHNLLNAEAPDWMQWITLSGVGYIFFGAMGASVLAVIFSAQAAAYANATGPAQQMHVLIFEAFGNAIQRGVWGILDPVLAGIWWTGLGVFLRKRVPVLGWFTIVLGVVNLAGGLSAAFRFDAVAGIGLNIYFVMAPLWAGWLGILLLRKKSALVPIP